MSALGDWTSFGVTFAAAAIRWAGVLVPRRQAETLPAAAHQARTAHWERLPV